MIFHLMAAGVPITWEVVAIYKDSYGIALNSARSWIEHEEADRKDSPYTTAETKPTPHFVVDLAHRDGQWLVKRHDLMMSERYLKRQEHDEQKWLLQAQTSPFPLDEDLKDAVTRSLRSALVDFGYLIPRDRWEQRYPSQKLISDHFRAFNQAYDAFRETGSADRMPFELRWAPYMESPAGFVWPFSVLHEGDAWIVTENGEPFGELSSSSKDEAETMMRLLNSGYRLKDVPVLMANEPVEEATS